MGRGRRVSDSAAVVLKIFKPSAAEHNTVYLKREFAILSKANIPGVIKAYVPEARSRLRSYSTR